MIAFICALIERFRARIAAATLDVEAGLIIKHAERKAVLLRLASRYEAEGLPTVAAEVRQRAERISFTKPLASLFGSVVKAAEQPQEPHTNGVISANGDIAPAPEQPPLTLTNTRKRR